MSLARKMKRRDVIPASRIRQIYQQGQLKGVDTMVKGTTEKLQEAYDRGFNEASQKAHIAMTLLAIAALRDTEGFGNKKLKRFADRLAELSEGVNAGVFNFQEIVGALRDEEHISFLSDVVYIEDGNGEKNVIRIDELIKEKK